MCVCVCVCVCVSLCVHLCMSLVLFDERLVYVCLIYYRAFLQLWLCLSALCVIDEHHAEVLSSGQWMGQDGKPRTKVGTITPHPLLTLL